MIRSLIAGTITAAAVTATLLGLTTQATADTTPNTTTTVITADGSDPWDSNPWD